MHLERERRIAMQRTVALLDVGVRVREGINPVQLMPLRSCRPTHGPPCATTAQLWTRSVNRSPHYFLGLGAPVTAVRRTGPPVRIMMSIERAPFGRAQHASKHSVKPVKAAWFVARSAVSRRLSQPAPHATCHKTQPVSSARLETSSTLWEMQVPGVPKPPSQPSLAKQEFAPVAGGPNVEGRHHEPGLGC